MRVAGVIQKNGKLLLLQRVRDGQKYYVFPGGSLEENETETAALQRELNEELGLENLIYRKLFDLENKGNQEAFYLIEKYSSVPTLGGPEKERMNNMNIYLPEWVEFSEMRARRIDVFPEEAVVKLISVFNT